jgi:hypothetical protein
VGFRKRDNAFVWMEDVSRLQAAGIPHEEILREFGLSQ